MCSAVDKKAEGRRQKAELGRLLFYLLISALCLLAGCASVDPVIKVALVAPFEGQQRAVGYDVIYSARLAVREVNEAGGIGGYRVALVALDDGSSPELARQVAESLAIDPAVVAVVGHWDDETTAVAAPIYAGAGIPFIVAGAAPIGQYEAALLPADFIRAYEAVTPFEETAGPYAASAYDAFQLLWKAMGVAVANEDKIDKTAVAAALNNLTYKGLTGTVYQTTP